MEGKKNFKPYTRLAWPLALEGSKSRRERRREIAFAIGGGSCHHKSGALRGAQGVYL